MSIGDFSSHKENRIVQWKNNLVSEQKIYKFKISDLIYVYIFGI